MARQQQSRAVVRQRSEHSLPVRRLASWMPVPHPASRTSGVRGRIPWSEVVNMKTILLVDHNAEHLLEHSDLLSRAGYRIVTAQDGKSALFIIESGMLLDLIVTEYTMPDMESKQFLATVRKEAPAVPVIVVTCCDSVECYIHAVNMGVYEYLNKPLLPGELHRIINSASHARQTGNLPAGLA
ncbi:MAG: response regulator [Nitrospirota bacterium]|nr:response regulator [Nitrospirota bacterium]